MSDHRTNGFLHRPTGPLRRIDALETARAGGRHDAAREARFLQLFLANEKRIYRYIVSLVQRWSDADDLLQETSATIWRKFDEFEPGTDFAAWALSIAHYQVLTYRKKQQRDRVVLFSAETIELIADRMASARSGGVNPSEALQRCLAKLNAKDAELIRLRYEPGATTRDVAERLGRSIQMVYKSLNKVHGRLLLCIHRALSAENHS